MGRGGESTGPLPAPADFLDSDPRFAPFLEDNFNAGDFASQALAKAEVTARAQAEQLQVQRPPPPPSPCNNPFSTSTPTATHASSVWLGLRLVCSQLNVGKTARQEGVRVLEGRLRSEVAARHEALLHQVLSVT